MIDLLSVINELFFLLWNYKTFNCF